MTVTRFEGDGPVGRYWLTRCEGFAVRGGTRGVVEELIRDADPHVTSRLVVRTPSRRRRVVDAAEVAVVDPGERLLVVDSGVPLARRSLSAARAAGARVQPHVAAARKAASSAARAGRARARSHVVSAWRSTCTRAKPHLHTGWRWTLVAGTTLRSSFAALGAEAAALGRYAVAASSGLKRRAMPPRPLARRTPARPSPRDPWSRRRRG
jgi:hypothetical protein